MLRTKAYFLALIVSLFCSAFKVSFQGTIFSVTAVMLVFLLYWLVTDKTQPRRFEEE